MSSVSNVAIVLSKVDEAAAIQIAECSLDLLIERYDFGFRGYGGIVALDFEGEEFIQERKVLDGMTSAQAIDRAELERLARGERWFVIGGSIRIPDVEQLVDLDIILYPTFDPDRPVCVLFRIDRELYANVDGDDGNGFDQDAADRLLRLCVSLGAHDRVDGFQAVLIAELDEVCPFDGAALRHSLLNPRSIQQQNLNRGGLRPGFVTGIKKAVLGQVDLTSTWSGYKIAETTNEFVLLNRLVDLRARLE